MVEAGVQRRRHPIEGLAAAAMTASLANVDHVIVGVVLLAYHLRRPTLQKSTRHADTGRSTWT